MSNHLTKRSELEIALSEEEMKSLIDLAYLADKSIEELVLQAVDQYIQREKALWDQRAKN